MREYVAQLFNQMIDGEIRQNDGDAGDSAQRTGHFYAILGMLKVFVSSETYEKSIKNFETHKPGIYRRTSDKSHWGSKSNNFSRDQWQALQLCFAVNGDKKRLLESMLALAKRFFFHQNWHKGTDIDGTWRDYRVPDISHPTHFSVFIRGMNWWPLYLILFLLDLFFLGDLIFRRGIKDADNMIFPQLAYANLKYPTLVSKIAMYFYLKTDFLQKINEYYEVGPDKNGINNFFNLFVDLWEKITGRYNR